MTCASCGNKWDWEPLPIAAVPKPQPSPQPAPPGVGLAASAVVLNLGLVGVCCLVLYLLFVDDRGHISIGMIIAIAFLGLLGAFSAFAAAGEEKPLHDRIIPHAMGMAIFVAPVLFAFAVGHFAAYPVGLFTAILLARWVERRHVS